MKQTAALRKKNWPVYNSILGLKFHGLTELRAEFKSYYLGVCGVDYSDIDNFCLERLMLAPEISDQLIDDVKLKFSKKEQYDRIGLIQEILRLQMQKLYGFGNNSLFQHQEARIIDRLGFYDIDWVEYYSERNERYKLVGLESYLSVPPSFDDYIESLSIPDNNQSWRSAKVWAAKIQATPKNAVPQERDYNLEYRILGMEAISRYPDSFDPKLVEVARVVQPVFSSKDTPDNARGYIQELIENQFDTYMSEQCVAGKAHICIKYESDMQVQAMQQILDPLTRPLCGQNQLDGQVYMKLRLGDGKRVVESILHPVLECGTVFNEIREVEPTALLCNRFMGISRWRSLYGMSGMIYDATDFDKRYRSKKKIEGHPTYMSRAKALPCAVVIECTDGSWKVGHPGGSAVSTNSKRKLEKIANAATSAEELAIELAHPSTMRFFD